MHLQKSRTTAIPVSPNAIFTGLTVMGILLTPLLSFQSVFSFFQGTVTSKTIVLDSYFIKSIKEILLILIIFIGLYTIIKERRIAYFALLFLFLIGLASFTSTALSVNTPPLTLASGYRWLLPVIAPMLIYKLVDKPTLITLTKPLVIIFIIHLSIQVAQLFFAPHYYGSSSYGLSQRNPGIFLIPQTAAFFSVTTLFFVAFYSYFSSTKKVFVFTLVVLSVFLTASAAGLLSVTIVLIIIATPRSKIYYLLPISFPVIYITLLYAGQILGRPTDFLEKSGGKRIEIFVDELSKASIFSENFGFSTNTAVLLGNGQIVDSWITSILGNTGILGLALFVLAFILWSGVAFVNRQKETLSLISIISGFGAVTIWTEAYPMNLLLGISLAHLLNINCSSAYKNTQTERYDAANIKKG